MQNGNQKAVDRQCKKNKETNNSSHELVCSGSLCSPSTIDTYHDTVKTTRTSYDMEFVLDTTKTQINTCKCEHKYSHS